MTNPNTLEHLVDYLRHRVHMTGHFQIMAGDLTGDSLTLCAPLEANLNDKQTAFAGTLATLCTLSGWAMTSLVCGERGLEADIAVVRSDIAYLRPCGDDPITARCFRPDALVVTQFLDEMQSRARAELELRAEVRSREKQAVEFVGRYCARRLT